jgi:flagellum-specific ATP synthase
MITSPVEARALAAAGRAPGRSQAGPHPLGGSVDVPVGRGADVTSNWQRFLGDLRAFSAEPVPLESVGLLVRVAGLVLEAAGIRVPVGSVCEVRMAGQPPVFAEVVGFNGDRAYLMPTGDVHGLASGAKVIPRPTPVVPMKLGAARHPWRRGEDRTLHLPVGDGLLGRVVDSHGHPMDRKGPIAQVHNEPLIRRPINAMDRDPVRRPLDTGVRAINAMLTVGRGQRIGLFAGTGVGKSVLLGMMARYTEADVIVVGLIGERGREVKEFIEDILGDEGLKRAVVVAAPADAPPLVRMQGANYATAIAEHFRDRGQNVLLLMDSLTRYAMAQREIALAIGEPPATKGYPPSCFAKLPQLVERSGNGIAGGGSITAFYTVLSEGDDPNDPIADAARGILDGHIVLSRELAEAGHYPAIDIEKSISRVMSNVAAPEHIDAARRFKQLHAKHNKARDLIQLGAYAPGHDAELDTAVRLATPMRALLQQDMHEPATLDASLKRLRAVVAA